MDRIVARNSSAYISLQASGFLGKPVLDELVKSGKFNITIIKREGSSASYPESLTVKTADLSSVESVTEAFKGADAVVSTVGTPGIAGQSILIEAAVAAGVKRFIPSDFGADLDNPKTKEFPVYKAKLGVHKALREASAANSNFTYTLVCNNAFLDWGLEKGVLINWRESKSKLFDGGEKKFSATSLESVGKSIVGILSHPEETKNRFVYIKDIDVSQKDLLELAKKIQPERTWDEPIVIPTEVVEKNSYESIAKGEITPMVMAGFIFRAIFGPPEYGGQYEKTDNELLGLKGKTLADVETLFRSIIEGSK
jgi:uncharacterized protein YbjT (DUF2867 family)